MAFGGLSGITPAEFLRRYGVNPTGIPGGIANFDVSQLSPNLRGPAIFPGFSAMTPTPAQMAMAPTAHPGLAGMMTPLDFDRALGMSRPLPSRIPGQFTTSFGSMPVPNQGAFPGQSFTATEALDLQNLGRVGAGLSPTRSAVEAAQAGQAQALSRSHQAAGQVLSSLQGTAGTEAIPLGPGALPPQVTGPQVFLPPVRDPLTGRMGPSVPPPSATGFRYPFPEPESFAPHGPRLPANVLTNGPGPIPGGAGTTFGLGPDANPISAMQFPRPPGAGVPTVAGEVPVSIRGAAPTLAADAAMAGAATAAAPAAATAATAVEAAAPGLLSRIAGRGALSTLSAGSGLTGGGVRAGGGRLLGRALLASLALGGARAVGADPFNTGTDDSWWRQAIAGGTAAGAPAGVLGGPVAAGVAAPIGAVANLATGGQFTESLGNLFGKNHALEDMIHSQLDQGDDSTLSDAVISRMDALNQGADARWEGVPDQVKDTLIADYNQRAGAATSLEERQQILFETAYAAEQAKAMGPELAAQQQAQRQEASLTPGDLAATQALASQFMAPIAADSAAIGQMGQTALTNLASGMNGPAGDSLRNLAGIQGQAGQNMANAYMQQAYSDPQIAALDQQLALRDQISQQLMQQAIQQLPQFATGGSTSFDDLLAGQALGGAGTDQTSQDMAALIAQGG